MLYVLVLLNNFNIININVVYCIYKYIFTYYLSCDIICCSNKNIYEAHVFIK